MATSRQPESKTSQQLMLLSPGRPANPSVLKDSEKDWMTFVVGSRLGSPKPLASIVHVGSCGRTSPESLQAVPAVISASSSIRWGSSGMGTPTECWTLNTSESPNDAVACLLSDILEDAGNVPPQCFLTEHNIQRLLYRLDKYKPSNSPLMAVLSGGQGMKPLSPSSSKRRRSSQPKAVKESASPANGS